MTQRVRLRDPELDAKLVSDGFVRVPFLSRSGVDALRRLWDEVGPVDPHGIYSNVHDRSPDTNRHVDRTITEIFSGPAAELFVNAHLAGASFLVKGTGANSASTPHQDWCNVDEHRSQSLSIWCPLVDVDARNGALQVVPGSHRLRRSIRSLDTPSLYLEFDEELEPHLRCVEASAGDAVLYAHNLFHGSKPNRSDQVRVCAVSGVVPTDCRLVHYRRASAGGEGAFDVLEVDRDFYFSGIPDMAAGRLPGSARVVERVTVERPVLEVGDVLGRESVRARVAAPSHERRGSQ
jgi:hypothetical protein